jgi:chromosome partitioning protein
VSKPSSGSSSPSPHAGSGATRTRKRGTPKAPETPGIARIVAIANQKGGVGKSTTAVSLGAALADLGYRVLVVDLDPQGNASTGMGIRHEERQVTSYDVIVAESPAADAIVHSPIERLDAITSTIDLAGAEIELVSQFSREGRLKRALETFRDGVYDFVFLDCPPSLGLITINALTAAEELIVPIQCEYYALEGLGQLLRNVSLVQQNINPELRLTGIVMTMFDPRTKLSEQVVAEVRRFFGDLVYDTIIPRTVRLSEAPGYGMPITAYDPRSKGAQSYRALALEVASRPPPDSPMPRFDEVPAIVVPSLGDDRPGGDDPDVAEDVPSPNEAAASDEVEEIHRETDEAVQAMNAAVSEAQPRTSSEAPEALPEVDDDDLWEEAERDVGRVRPVTNNPPGELPPRRVVVIDEAEEAAQGRDGGSEGQPADQGPAIGGTLRQDDEGQRRRWRLFRKGGE